MGSLLVEGDFVVTMDKGRRILRNGAVYVEDDKIRAVGDASELRSNYRPERVLGGKRRLVIPPFVNVHDHMFHMLYRCFGDDLNLEPWLEKSVFPVGAHLEAYDLYIGAKACFAEQIKAGISVCMDDTVPWIPNRISKEQAVDEIAKAAEETGIRIIQAVGGVDVSENLGTMADIYYCDVDSAKRAALNTIKKYNTPASKVRIWTNASWPPTCTAEMYQTLKQIADENNTWTYSHLAESMAEVKLVKSMTGKTPAEYLDSLGFLDENALFAHCVWLTDSEINRFKRTDAKVAHQPVSNQYLASGVSPVPKMLQMGITVGLGMDDAGHHNEDFFDLMKSCALLHKVAQYDASVMTAEKVLEMATIDGARAVGMSDSVGSLEVGKKADMIVIDLKGLNQIPVLRPIINLVYAGMPTDVETTVIDGEILMENRKLTHVDEEKLIEETEKAAWNLVARAGSEGQRWITHSALGWKIPSP